MIVQTQIPQLDVLNFPLYGSHLIEASAGTGKTWTIAALYVRLVLGHGVQTARLPADILVLTFTDAAALELRDRIRSRLSQAARYFASTQGVECLAQDPFLQSLRDAWPIEQHTACARSLDLAAQSMDEAAISTIHAWCARVLQEHAFDSGSLFEQQLKPDLSDEIRETAWDYWRIFVANLDPEQLALVRTVWDKPQDLLSLSSFLTRPQTPAEPEVDLFEVLEQFQARSQARLQVLKAPWQEGADELEHWLIGLGKDWKARPSDVRGWVEKLRAWARDPQAVGLDLSKTAWQRLSLADISEKWLGSLPVPEHPLCTALQQLETDLNALPSVHGPLLQHALGWMATRLKHTLSQAAVLGFDGLLSSLDAALDGPRAAALVQTLRQQYPIVLIDEFQDTDPVQYRIFDRIYRVSDNNPDTTLVLIGDPKQSIYSFRGADVHTYLRAARACVGRVQTLGCNYRSSQAMVQAVNGCFSFSQGPVFTTSLEHMHIDFHPVQAQGRDECWEIDGQPAAALTACWLESESPDKPLSTTRYRQDAAVHCAHQIAHLLSLGRQGRAGLRAGPGLTPVRPADLAVLVNDHTEARILRLALAQAGVRSVFLSERESVYESAQAHELGLWLAACVQPENERMVRAALATPSLGLSWQMLDQLVEDESAWDIQAERFQMYRQIWQQRGVLPMLRQLLHDFEVPARLLSGGTEGERQLTDILHLAELLQEAAAHLDGMQAVLRHLQQQCQSPQAEDSRRLRLESDEDLVRVVTVHKSKGLEYPLVFLPFVCHARLTTSSIGPYLLPQGDSRLWVMQASPEQLQKLDQERLGEDVRKLYVALTRARHAVWMTFASLKDPARRGISQVLGPDLRENWDQLVQSHPDLYAWAKGLDTLSASQDLFTGTDLAAGPARVLRARVVSRPWWISSYSALSRNHSVAPDSPLEEVLQESRLAVQSENARLLSGGHLDYESQSVLQDFPRGSESGTFLHGLLEWAARRNFQLPPDTRDLIARRCAVRGWESYIDMLYEWLQQLVGTSFQLALPLEPQLRLNQLDASLPEMEFWLPVQQVSVEHLDQLITQHVFATKPRPGLAPGQLNGMFKGYIDLSLKTEGRYYILDYKSNYLGPDPDDYRPAALAAAVCAARYDVQLITYVLALHRQLRARLPDYDYASHMGGAVCLFLRGQTAPGQGLVSLRPDPGLILQLDALFDGQEALYV